MSGLKQSLGQGAQWYNDRPYRERILLLVTTVIVVLLVGWELAVSPVLAQNERLAGQIRQVEQQQQDWLTQQQALEQAVQQDPNAALIAQLRQRQERLEALDNQLAQATDGLVEPEAMVGLLRNMLVMEKGLGLVSMTLLDPIPVYSDADAATRGELPLLYAHDVEFTVAGRYLDLMRYLTRLEGLDQRLGWGRLEYQVDEFPQAEARVRVRTLSLSQAGLGV